MIPFAMIGAAGRMGRSIIALCESENMRLSGAMEHAASVHVNADAGDISGAEKLECKSWLIQKQQLKDQKW